MENSVKNISNDVEADKHSFHCIGCCILAVMHCFSHIPFITYQGALVSALESVFMRVRSVYDMVNSQTIQIPFHLMVCHWPTWQQTGAMFERTWDLRVVLMAHAVVRLACHC